VLACTLHEEVRFDFKLIFSYVKPREISILIFSRPVRGNYFYRIEEHVNAFVISINIILYHDIVKIVNF